MLNEYILAIETSFDDTAAALVCDGKVITNIRQSRAGFSLETKGVVPWEAAKTHRARIDEVIQQALNPMSKDQKIQEILRENSITIAVTYGPGLSGCLKVGVEKAKSLAIECNLPIVPISHLEAHILASSASEELSMSSVEIERKLPAICLVVSGGNTLLIKVDGIGKYYEIGRTRDDAAGEAFDKIARLLGLGFPGGPEIAKLASEFCKNPKYQTLNSKQIQITNNKFSKHLPADKARFNKLENLNLNIISDLGFSASNLYKLPRPMLYSKDFDFSFSGLKTAVANMVRGDGIQHSGGGGAKRDLPRSVKSAIAHEVQEAITDVLVHKTIAAADKHNIKNVWLTGGVAANTRLREKLSNMAIENGLNISLCPIQLTTDNAAMIGLAAYIKGDKYVQKPEDIEFDPNLRI